MVGVPVSVAIRNPSMKSYVIKWFTDKKCFVWPKIILDRIVDYRQAFATRNLVLPTVWGHLTETKCRGLRLHINSSKIQLVKAALLQVIFMTHHNLTTLPLSNVLYGFIQHEVPIVEFILRRVERWMSWLLMNWFLMIWDGTAYAYFRVFVCVTESVQ